VTTTPTWQTEAVLSLPFDQYQRYATAARVVEALGGTVDRLVLDVGGAPGFVEQFFPGARAAVVDRYGTHGGNFVVADGAALPFEDDAFDVVITLDTLEHIFPQHRAAFLSECRRVSRDYVVLSAPHATEGVQLAERALQSFVTARFGEVFGTLQEHEDNGLPLIGETLASLTAPGWNVARLPSGYLPRWLLGMLVHHELLATGLPELPELHRFYNEQQSLHDNAEPSYRQVVVASVRPQSERDELVAGLRSPGTDSPETSATLAAIGGRVLEARLAGGSDLAAQRARIQHLTVELAESNARAVDVETALERLTGELGALRQEQERALARLQEQAEALARAQAQAHVGPVRQAARRLPSVVREPLRRAVHTITRGES